jgi:acetyl esterase/lipase
VGANGVPSEWITAPGADEGRVVLYFHGGGFVFGSMRTHRVMLAHLSRAAKARVLGLDYRLAPENPFPAPIEDALAAYRWLLDQGIDPKKITLAGDSAGGGLVLSALVAIRYAGLPMPAAGIPISAWTDMEATGESMTTNAEADTWVDRDGLLNIAKVYLNGKDPRAPLASPLHADLRGLPPLLMQVGGVEVLLDDTTALAERAKEAGVSVEVEVWDDMPHVWHTFAPILPEGEKAIDRIGEFILQHTG